MTNLESRLRKAIQEQIKKIVEEAKNAADRAEKRVNEQISILASVLSQNYSIENFGNTLRIEIKISKNP
jgi:hypothetical protein